MSIRQLAVCVALILTFVYAAPAEAQPDLIVDGTTITLGGIQVYDEVRVINGGKIIVPDYDGVPGNKTTKGNLQIKANLILIDATSSIIADGAGYQPRLCDEGDGPNNTAGGRGGCSVLDSGGGGAHFGAGGRGTKDCFCDDTVGLPGADPNNCQFPAEFEEDCGDVDPITPNTCMHIGPPPTGVCEPISSICYDYNGTPTVAGQAYVHSVYEVEFGAAGGDKGCRDSWQSCNVGGAGGGRIVLAAVNAQKTGTLSIKGRVSAEGNRGCGKGNDSGGGGAGGSLLLVADAVDVDPTAYVSVRGGVGGDTQGHPDCPPCAQSGGVCDDCGGGGGGGIISVLSGVPAKIEDLAVFDVRGSEGGTCTICKGEAGGSAGELQLNGQYVGEICDGYDNDFDGQVDEFADLGKIQCGCRGACSAPIDACNVATGTPNDCTATPPCQLPLTDTRSRFMVVVDTSGSMLTDLSGRPTFGDGSALHPGIDTDGNGATDDSRLFKAKQALTNVISAYPEIDFGIARYAQGVGPAVSCQLAHWFECAGLCCTYDNPIGNSGGTPPGGMCSLDGGAQGPLVVQPVSGGEECINYAGSCGPPNRGADILVGFEKPINQKLMWLDHKETNFQADTTEGDHCNFASGGDCELRGTGPTPLDGALRGSLAYMRQERLCDPIASCRQQSVILLTDGTETCQGNAVQAAAALLAENIKTYVIGFSVLPSEQSALNAIAATGGTTNAFFANDQQQLSAALAAIVADSIVFEKCNNLDDDCDTLVDEDFPLKGTACDNGKLGACLRPGTYVCKADGSGVECNAPDATGTPEICNGIDDDCDGAIDEDFPGGCGCIPEICNGLDDDCNGIPDDGIAEGPCGTDVGACQAGTLKCIAGNPVCEGSIPPTAELCNGIDDDCDGKIDDFNEACYPMGQPGCDLVGGSCVGQCRFGVRTCTAGTWSACVGVVGPEPEICDGIDNDCDGATDVAATCPGSSQCVQGQCMLPCAVGEFVCPTGQICRDGFCRPDGCNPTTCSQTGPNFICSGGECIDACQNVTCGQFEQCVKGACIDMSCYGQGCPAGQTCVQAQCVTDPCAGVSCGTDAFCAEGQCVKLCDGLQCPNGQTCQVTQQGGVFTTGCADDPCSGINCTGNFECVAGTCVPDPCSGISCAKGQVCIEGTCVIDACEKVTCPAGYLCQQGNCLPGSDVRRRQLLATGSGGFSCATGGQPPSPLLLLLLALCLIRRRRAN